MHVRIGGRAIEIAATRAKLTCSWTLLSLTAFSATNFTNSHESNSCLRVNSRHSWQKSARRTAQACPERRMQVACRRVIRRQPGEHPCHTERCLGATAPRKARTEVVTTSSRPAQSDHRDRWQSPYLLERIACRRHRGAIGSQPGAEQWGVTHRR